MLKTKSIQLRKSKSDGFRICIMRRPDPGLDWDIWIPHLAPSNELLSNYHDKKVDWSEFEVLFTKEVLKKKKEYLMLVAEMAQTRTITLLCWEETPHMCHRRLVAEELQRKNPKLDIVIK